MNKLNEIRPKAMRQSYGDDTVYLHRRDNVLHLIHGPHDFVQIETWYGQAIAAFNPYQGQNGKWVDPGALGDDDLPMSLAELRLKIGEGEICGLGKDCWKHK